MRLYMIGANHYDPLGRALLVEALRVIAQEENAPPAWVGVEYDSRYHGELVAHRTQLKSLIESDVQGLPEGRSELLALAMGFDGDAHLDEFPDCPTIWLDQGRTTDAVDTVDFTFTVWARNAPDGIGGDLSPLRERLFAIASGEIIEDRDLGWANTLEQHLDSAEPSHKWAAAVVGSLHLDLGVSVTVASVLHSRGVELKIQRIDQ